MYSIRLEIGVNKDLLKNAPHTAKVVTANKWDYNYSREEAAYPASQTNKFWQSRSRIDNVYGDRNLVCSCEDYFILITEKIKAKMWKVKYALGSLMKLPKSMMIICVMIFYNITKLQENSTLERLFYYEHFCDRS